MKFKFNIHPWFNILCIETNEKIGLKYELNSTQLCTYCSQ